MAVADGERLLNYALPVVRYLGVRRVRIPCYRINAARPTFDSASAEPAGLRPTPEGMWESVVRAAESLLPEDARDNADTQFVLEVNEPAWWVEEMTQAERLSPSRPLALEEQACPPDFGLSSFLKGVWYAPLGHLILADRLEDQSGPSAIATALRASEADLYRPGRYSEWTSHDAFRWRWLEREVLCYASRCCSHWLEKRLELKTVGFVLGLLHRSEGTMARRWARWVAEGAIGRQLAAEMGVTLQGNDEPWTDL
jgi:hypothetical protein